MAISVLEVTKLGNPVNFFEGPDTYGATFLATVAEVESSSAFATLREKNNIVWHPQKMLSRANFQEKMHRVSGP